MKEILYTMTDLQTGKITEVDEALNKQLTNTYFNYKEKNNFLYKMCNYVHNIFNLLTGLINRKK